MLISAPITSNLLNPNVRLVVTYLSRIYTASNYIKKTNKSEDIWIASEIKVIEFEMYPAIISHIINKNTIILTDNN